MPVAGDILFRDREEILKDMQDQFRLLIPDIYLGPDGNLNLLLQVMAGVIESVFLANQVVSEDMFILTASEGALERWGDQFGVPRKTGDKSTGQLKFGGQGGTFIPIGTEVAHDPGTGDPVIYFRTIEEGVIPDPGDPTAPTTALNGAGNITGTIEYAVAFTTAAGETIIGPESVPVIAASNKILLTDIPLGGPNTIGRKIYRQKDGDEIWKLVTTINDNVSTIFDDNVTDGALGANPVAFSTAEFVTVDGESETPGFSTNLGIGTITVLTNVADGITMVANSTLFSGGTDSETSFDYRQRLLRTVRAPSTGSPSDIKAWAEEVNGVDSATVYENNNLGLAQNGHVTVRIAGPNSAQPSVETLALVQAELDEIDLANITIHVAGFTNQVINVTVDVLLEEGFTLADVESAVQLAIADYINSLEVGEDFKLSGVIAAVYNLPGIEDVNVISPTFNQVLADSTSKWVVGTIAVT